MDIKIADGIRLHVEVRGEGPPVLFVHGFPLNLTMWNAQLDALSDEFHVIAPDLRGFGNSGLAASDVLTMDQFADDCNALLDALEIQEPVAFCGLSMGGYIAFRFVEKYGDRLRSLILCDTRPGADTPDGVENRRRLAKNVLRSGAGEAVNAMLPKLVAEKTNLEQPQVLVRIREMIEGTHPKSIAAALMGMAERPDSTSVLSSLSVPTLVLCGSEDSLTPPDVMRDMADAIPSARYVEFPDAGHMAPMEAPHEVNAAIRELLVGS